MGYPVEIGFSSLFSISLVILGAASLYFEKLNYLDLGGNRGCTESL